MSTLLTKTSSRTASEAVRREPICPDSGDDDFDGHVVDAARQGDPAAWEHIYRRFGPRLTRFAASRGIPDPEDVTQEVMYAAAARIHRFTGGEGDLRSWLFTIAYRRCADHHRYRHRRPELPTDRLPEQAEPHDGADAGIWADGDGREAFAALDILTERERAVVSLRIVGELDTGDVADALELSNTNVRVIQSRALAKLRRYLEGNGGFLDKRFRGVSILAAIATGKTGPLRRLGDMREALPTGDLLGDWTESLRGGRTQAPPHPSATAAFADIASTGPAVGANAATVPAQVAAAVVVAGVVMGGIGVTPLVSEPPSPASSAPVPTASHQADSAGGGPDGWATVAEDRGERRMDAVAPVGGGRSDSEPTPIPAGVLSPQVKAAVELPDEVDAVEAVERTRLVHQVRETADQIEEKTISDIEAITAGDSPAGTGTDDAGAAGLPSEATSTTVLDEPVAHVSATRLGQGTVGDGHPDGPSLALDD